MRILILSNMYPSTQKPYSGVFVKNQFEYLRDNVLRESDTIEIKALQRTFTGKFGSILKYIRFFITLFPYFFRRFDVIHLHFFFPLGAFTFLYKIVFPQTKVFVTFHGEDINTLIPEKGFVNKLFRAFGKKVTCVIAVGDFIKEQIEKKLGLTKNIVLPVGIDNRVFYLDRKEQKYDLIYVGSFVERKGVDILLEALKDLVGLKICFIGSGILQKEIEKLSDKHFIDLYKDQTQDQINDFLNQSRFIVLFSRSEGFPTSTVEAMYAGTPVLGSDIPQIQEQIRNGENGFYCDLNANSARELIEKALSVDEQTYLKMQNECVKSFREISLKTVCHRLYLLYDKGE